MDNDDDDDPSVYVRLSWGETPTTTPQSGPTGESCQLCKKEKAVTMVYHWVDDSKNKPIRKLCCACFWKDWANDL